MNNWTYIRVITTTLNDQNHIFENCIGSVINFFYFDSSPIRLHGEGGVYDLYCSQPPGGDQRARSFTFPDMWGTPGSVHDALRPIQAIHPQSRRGRPLQCNAVW